jgi:hypothetical protein
MDFTKLVIAGIGASALILYLKSGDSINVSYNRAPGKKTHLTTTPLDWMTEAKAKLHWEIISKNSGAARKKMWEMYDEEGLSEPFYH